ncbi:MAG: tyrosine-type recombinase/integrase [Chthoniobacterales bacterium]
MNLPAALSHSGRRERRYFADKKSAVEFCRQQKIRLENYGTASTYLPAGKIEEAQAAFEKLQGTGVSLTEAIDQFLRARRSRECSTTFREMFEAFIENKSVERSSKYISDLKYCLPRFAPLYDCIACDVTSQDVEELLQATTPSVHNAFARYLRAAFNFGIRRGWCTENPVNRIEMRSLKHRKEILSNAQVKALLDSVCELDFALLPYHLLCLFAGIRPEEAKRLDWSNIEMTDQHVEVPDESAKTSVRRIVEMEPLLVRWLAYYLARGGTNSGPVAPARNLRTRLRSVRNAAGIEKWPQDAPRRTYASCWLAVHNDVNRLNNMMGHTSPAMLWKHYHRAVTQRQAGEFWKIEPPTSA